MMDGSPVRRGLRRLQRLALGRRARTFNEDELRCPAMVFAPHPDDETLGPGHSERSRHSCRHALQLVIDGPHYAHEIEDLPERLRGRKIQRFTIDLIHRTTLPRPRSPRISTRTRRKSSIES